MNYGIYKMIDLWREMAFSNDELKDITRKKAISDRQIACLEEELNELNNALGNTLKIHRNKDNHIEAIDGYCDVLWVACMLSSIHDFNPIRGVQIRLKRSKGYDMTNDNFIYRHQRLSRSIRKLRELKNDIYKDDNVYMSNFKDHLVTIIYRAYQGLNYIISQYKLHTEVYADQCLSQVIYSNFSKCVDGHLPKDSTGKITKQPAKDKGTYIEPDFSFVIPNKNIENNLMINKTPSSPYKVAMDVLHLLLNHSK